MVSGPRVVLVLSLVVVSILTAAPGSIAAERGETPHESVGAVERPQVDAESDVTQTFLVDLQQNGDARWTITKTVPLTSQNETDAFDDLAASFEAGETSSLGLPSYRNASDAAARSTGREMTITNESLDAERTGTATNGTGRLSVSFTWTNFGRLDEDRFYIDDVFTTGQGPWFDGLYPSQKLVIRPPDGYEFFDAPVPVTLRNGTIQWTGPEDFTTETLSATFERTGNGGPTTPPTVSPDPPTTTGTPSGGGEGESGSLLWAGLLTVGLGAVVVGYLLVRDRDGLAFPGSDGGESPVTDASDGPDDGTAEATAGGATAGTVGAAESDDEAAEQAEEAIDEELLSDEERVERLLEENGGRMKQANIVKETDWSNAKVSQLLSAMEEDGQINKLRIGRENLISFPDEDITDLEE
jgi:hypothetical protein